MRFSAISWEIAGYLSLIHRKNLGTPMVFMSAVSACRSLVDCCSMDRVDPGEETFCCYRSSLMVVVVVGWPSALWNEVANQEIVVASPCARMPFLPLFALLSLLSLSLLFCAFPRLSSWSGPDVIDFVFAAFKVKLDINCRWHKGIKSLGGGLKSGRTLSWFERTPYLHLHSTR